MFAPSLSPDGATIYFRTFADPKGEIALVMARDLNSGAEREVYRFSVDRWVAIAIPRDGNQLAFAVIGTLRSSMFKRSSCLRPGDGANRSGVAGKNMSMEPNRGLVLWGPSDNLTFTLTNAKREAEVWSVGIDGSGAQRTGPST